MVCRLYCLRTVDGRSVIQTKRKQAFWQRRWYVISIFFFRSLCLFLDHLALIIELLGEQKTQHLIIGKYGKHFFDPNGDLKNIKKLKFWPLQQVLVYVREKERRGRYVFDLTF